ncbi:MAG TPA: neutral zinc metallopeptidase [Verrucomicrobiae bacterium]|nr:neutral zinc metallopeptidase [Verrucomicrobiae bacterium]
MAYWDKLTSQGNVEDRRGASLAGGIGGLGLVGTLIFMAFTYFTSGGDLNAVLSQLEGLQTTQQTFQKTDFDGSDEYPKFASTVLGSNNETWQQIFAASGKTYTAPKLVLFRQATQSGCGIATSEVGPHYCPLDSTIYLDETFFDELQRRFKTEGGDVAEAYVISHEVGHHVQNLLGITEVAERTNEESIRIELQADCFAGTWANSVAPLGVFEPGEIKEAIDAAAAVGDDRIQKTVTGRVDPESWTHGSSEQRVTWFTKGFETGKPSNCTVS